MDLVKMRTDVIDIHEFHNQKFIRIELLQLSGTTFFSSAEKGFDAYI